ncbi:MAG: acyl-CoA desaturase [Planctomycetes bacterium]|nr:acyl-CoA desaturase [Planctomycetota bacterium]
MQPVRTFLRHQFQSVVRWFDSWSGTRQVPVGPGTGPKRVEWSRVLPFLGVHAMCLFVFVVGFSWAAVGVCLAMYLVRMFAVTGFYHRYFSHKTFRTSRAVQFLMAVAGATATQRGPLWWASHHRLHHKHSDQPEDVHSPHQHGLWWSHMGWITSGENFRTDLRQVPDLARYAELRFLDRFDTLVPFLTGAAMFFLGMALGSWAPGLGTSAFQMLVWGYFVSTVLLFHGTCTINSLSHLIGRRRYPTSDQSRNSWILALVTLGEGWHNNHHYYQASTRQGFFWWELDVTYYGLKLLSWLGLIWDLRPVPAHVRAGAPRTRRG